MPMITMMEIDVKIKVFLTNQLLTNSQSTLHTWKIFVKGHICKNLFRLSSVFLQRICEGRVVEVAWSQRESGLDWKIKWQGPEIDHCHPGPSSPLSSWKEWRKSSTGEELLKYLREMDFFLCLSLSSELELPLRFQDPHLKPLVAKLFLSSYNVHCDLICSERI